MFASPSKKYISGNANLITHGLCSSGESLGQVGSDAALKHLLVVLLYHPHVGSLLAAQAAPCPSASTHHTLLGKEEKIKC